jgi:hypothetical protein
MSGFATIERTSGRLYWPLERSVWRKCKHGYARIFPNVVHNGIYASRAQPVTMVANTSCSGLLVQGASVCPP